MKKTTWLLVALFLIGVVYLQPAKAAVDFSVNFDNGYNANLASIDATAQTDGTFPALVTGYGGTGKAIQNTYGTTIKYKASNLNNQNDSIFFKFQLPFNLSGDQSNGKIAEGYSKIDESSTTKYIYIADNTSNQIIRASMDGAGWQTLGGYGATGGDGKFNFCYNGGVSVDPADDTLYIADSCNNRIVKTKMDGSAWQTYETTGHQPGDISYDPTSGFIYYQDVANSEIVRVKFGGADLTSFSYSDFSSYLTDIFYDSVTNKIYFTDAGNNNIGRVNVDGSNPETFGSEGSDVGQFESPYSLSVSNGFIYVSDENNHRLVKTKFDGSGWQSFGSVGNTQGHFTDALNLAYDPTSDFIYVLDNMNHTDPSNYLIKTKIDGTGWTGYATQGIGVIDSFDSMVYDHATGNFYFAGYASSVISTKKDGTGWQTIGQSSNAGAPYDFLYLTGMDIDPTTKDIYALDHYYNKILKFNMAQNVWQTYGGPDGPPTRDFSNPRGLTFDPATNLFYAGDTAHNRIVETKMDGSVWQNYGSYGSGVGQFKGPMWVYYDKITDYIYVSDSDNSRVDRFKMDIGDASWQEVDTSAYGPYGGIPFIVQPGTDSIFVTNSDGTGIVKLNMNTSAVENTFDTSSYPGNPSYLTPAYYDTADNTMFLKGANDIYHVTATGTFIEEISARPDKVLLKSSGNNPFEVGLSAYTGKFSLSLNKYDQPIYFTPTQTMTQGSWHSLKVDFNRTAGTVSLYLDGSTTPAISQSGISSQSFKTMADIGSYIYIGSDPSDPNKTFPGAIDDLAFGVNPSSGSSTPTPVASATTTPPAMSVLPKTGL